MAHPAFERLPGGQTATPEGRVRRLGREGFRAWPGGAKSGPRMPATIRTQGGYLRVIKRDAKVPE